MNFLNIPKLMRLRQEAQDKRDWHAELHYGSLGIASGMVWGLILGISFSIVYWRFL